MFGWSMTHRRYGTIQADEAGLRMCGSRDRRLRGPRVAGVLVTTLLVVGTSAATVVPAQSQADSGQSCAALYVLGVQGADEAGAGNSVTTDSGVLSQILQPLTTGAPTGQIDRAYVAYDTGDTAAAMNPDNAKPAQYGQAIAKSLAQLRQMTQQFLARCSSSDVAVVGYRQGAVVASQFAQQIGHGTDPIHAERVAAVALLDDPSRPSGAALFPGRDGKTVPDPAPGTPGTAVGAVQPLSQQPALGGGIGAQPGAAADFGALAGRVANVCIAGGLTCDTQAQSPIQRVVSNITGAAASAHGDPLQALGAVTNALAFTTINTVSAVVNNDVQGDSLDTLDYSPGESLSQRVAEASDPHTPLDIGGALQAVLRVGTIGLNAVVTVLRTVLTPANIAQVAAAGLANPAVGLAILGQQLLGAIPQLIPPITVVRLVSEAFTAVVQNIKDNTPGATNKDLVDTTNAVKYSDALTAQQPYTTAPVAADGAAPSAFITAWFSAAARDLATAHPATSTATSAPGAHPTATSAPGANPWNALPETSTPDSPGADASELSTSISPSSSR